MELIVEKKFLEGTWWKYGLLLVAAKLALWVALAYHWNPQLDWNLTIHGASIVYSTFAVTAFLPFVFGRLQMRRLFWFSLAGFFAGEAAYLFLGLARFGTVINLLPFIAYMQLYASLFGLGLIAETGRFAWVKLTQ
jgi:hypothetical protein